MRLITQCPVCSTMFKVVPDQLRLSQGWVRCGQCDEVFDANAHMYMDALAAGSAIDEAAPVRPVMPPITPQPEAASETVAYQVTDLSSRDLGREPSFMRRNRPHPVWHRPVVRLGLGLAGVVLVLLLLLQVTVQERDRIAAYRPAARAGLEALCGRIQCTVRPLRQMEAVVIDSSSFVRVRADTYRLHATLKNTAPVEIAMPALELTLIDMRERVLVRRVLLPPDWGSAQPVMRAGVEIAVSVPLSLKLPEGTERNSGYRLLAFYP